MCSIVTYVRVEKPKEKKPKLEDTDASSYFESSNKVKRTAVPQRKAQTRKKKIEDDDFIVDDDDFEFDETLIQEIEKSQPAEPTTTNGTKKENTKATPKKAAPTTKKEDIKTPTKRKSEVVSSEDEFIDPVKHTLVRCCRRNA